MTTPNEPAWTNEDLACPLSCIDVSYPYVRDLLDDPSNDERTLLDLTLESWAFGAQHLEEVLTEEGSELRARLAENEDASVIACEPLGFYRTVLSPLPWKLMQLDDRVVMEYEEWEVTRTVYMDGRDHPADLTPSLYGHSIGRFEGPVLVIESAGILPGVFYPDLGGGGHSDQLRTIERYSLVENGGLMSLEFTLIDPVTLAEPLTFVKRLRRTPDVELLDHSCEVISGEF
jgi:hypothetical protein